MERGGVIKSKLEYPEHYPKQLTGNMEEKELKLKREILELEIKKLTLEIELEKMKHKEYWQPITTTTTGDYIPRPLETFR